MNKLAKELFAAQPMMLECSAPLNICGDIHGQLSDLIRIFNMVHSSSELSINSTIFQVGWPPTVNYLFLGDYIDRGQWSVETILLLLLLKLKFPDNFLLLRGNHETVIVNRIYGFYEDLVRRFGTPRLFNSFQDVFAVMPMSAIVSDRILCMHGGLSPQLLSAASIDILNRIARPVPDPPNPSLPLDLLWADPDINIKKFKFSIRGVSCTFGPDVLQTVLEKFGLDLVARAHQVVQDGYEFFSNRKLVTIFSAPHYCGQFDNAAAVMIVNDDLQCSFKVKL
ncbi:phosphoprotein phosphatase 1 domain protein [Necator americanus]|uniref:Serine/threonine-protein phosphatase n=1 Tax=Necator americanus TaxID=51031 RepID=W2SUR0_NECAM|nr:phosphoprotein phosphatase 1 domain protein [Necator americanus]ETN73248.1 phosphoprotein phosphatase 1 domain protein [Necator americanus]